MSITDNFSKLPLDIHKLILRYLNRNDKLTVRSLSKHFNKIVSDYQISVVWKSKEQCEQVDKVFKNVWWWFRADSGAVWTYSL
jgi:hypothetical protein